MKKRVLFVIYTIFGGGAEKQMQYLLQYLNRDLFEPHLCVFSLNDIEREYIPSGVQVHDLSTRLRPGSLFLVFKLLSLVRKIRPFKIVSFTWGVNLIAICAGLLTRIPVIVSERIYTKSSVDSHSFKLLRKIAISLLYRFTEKIVVVGEEVKRGLIEHFLIPEKKIQVIYNGIDIEDIKIKSREYKIGMGDYILSCGSLTKKKNFSSLIAAVSRLPNTAILIILGQGILEKHLRQKAVEMGVNLVLPGYVKNPYSYFKNAKVFVSSSEYEGFPNVILEAMACEVPIIAVDCPGGNKELIEDGKTGLLISDINKLPQAIEDIKVISKGLIYNARKRVDGFNIGGTVNEYERLISKSD